MKIGYLCVDFSAKASYSHQTHVTSVSCSFLPRETVPQTLTVTPEKTIKHSAKHSEYPQPIHIMCLIDVLYLSLDI